MMKNVKNVDTVVIDGVRFVKEGAPAATENKMPVVKNCYFSGDRTIVLWDDGTKTVVQCQPGDQFDPEKGIFAAIAKRAYGNTGKFNDVMRTANDMGEYNFIKEMAKNPDAMTKLIEDLFYSLANSDEEDDEDDVCDKSLPSALPERTCVNCGRTMNNGGWYADGGTRCPIEEHYALPKDGYCHLWEKRNVADDDYPEKRTDE